MGFAIVINEKKMFVKNVLLTIQQFSCVLA